MIMIFFAALAAAGATTAPADELTLERTALVMRHGVRTPLETMPMPEVAAPQPWPAWTEPAGHLTAHGAAAVRQLGDADRRFFTAVGALPAAGCPAPGRVRVRANNVQRTLATGEAYLEGFAPNCGLKVESRPAGELDPLYQPIHAGRVPWDEEAARRAWAEAAGPGGIEAIDRRVAGLYERIDRIICGEAQVRCGVVARDTIWAGAGHTAGRLERASVAGQNLMLAYADGRPASDVGWGRASLADLEALSQLHAIRVDLTARPLYVAARQSAPLMREILGALEDGPESLLVLVGHDGNVAALGGLLDLHWKAGGFARDDQPPGGGVGFQVARDRDGNRFVRAIFRAQSLGEMRTLAAPDVGSEAYLQILTIPGCPQSRHAGYCRWSDFRRLVEEKLAGAELRAAAAPPDKSPGSPL